MLLDLPLTAGGVQIVGSFEELAATPFGGGINAFCWLRKFDGNFLEVVEKLGGSAGVESLDEERLRGLQLSAGGLRAVEVMLGDLQLLLARGWGPELNCIHGYPRDEESGAVRTDVYSFHVDSAPVAAETWLCTYAGAPSEGLANEQAIRRVDIPATRAALLKEFGGDDGEEFRAFLSEGCYDLHFAALPPAQPYSFGLGNLWRIAVDYPGSPVPPCIHRAPETQAGDPGRLLLIS